MQVNPFNSTPSLAGAAINLSALRESGKKEVENLLRGVSGTKCVVLDPMLARPLNLVTEVSFYLFLI